MDKEYVIYKHLKHLGIPASLQGFGYLLKGIELVMDHPEYLRQITKMLYPEIARAFNTTANRVERGIRHATEVVFNNTDSAILYEYFGNATKTSSGKLTNSQFIAGIATYINMEVYHDKH